MNSPCPIIRPRYYVAQLADAMKGDWRGYHLSQKMDGIWQVRQFNDSTITGERMRDGSFYAFDVVQVQGDDVRRCQWRDRREALIELAQHFPAGWQIAPEGHGAEFIEAVLASGGEGVVAKNFESYFGVGWHKIKRQETFDVRVEGKLFNAVRISLNGEPAGCCGLRGWKYDRVQFGDIIEISAFRRNASGKFREPRFIRFRDDKKNSAPLIAPRPALISGEIFLID